MEVPALVALALVALIAATVNGGLGYGFSSITVPIALLFTSSRELNPALVLVELGVNGYSLYLNRHAIRSILPRVAPIVLGIFPGVALGSLLLRTLDPKVVKLTCYSVMLPLIFIQISGRRWPMRRERAVAAPFGFAIGTLYSLTTISGPPLALFFNNQGLTKSDFRVALAVVRVFESSVTLIAYISLGLISSASCDLTVWLIPGVAVGMPLGHALLSKVTPDTFRRICMSFDAWIVAFGLSRLVHEMTGVHAIVAYLILASTLIADVLLLRRFLDRQRTIPL